MFFSYGHGSRAGIAHGFSVHVPSVVPILFKAPAGIRGKGQAFPVYEGGYSLGSLGRGTRNFSAGTTSTVPTFMIRRPACSPWVPVQMRPVNRT